jgi:hypothetical protein
VNGATPVDTAAPQIQKENTMNKSTSKKQKRLAKKAFPKVARNERPFSKADYDALPKE